MEVGLTCPQQLCMFDLAHLHQFKANVYVESPHIWYWMDTQAPHDYSQLIDNLVLNLHFNLMCTKRRSLQGCCCKCRLFFFLKYFDVQTELQTLSWQPHLSRQTLTGVWSVCSGSLSSLPPSVSLHRTTTLRDHRHWQEARNSKFSFPTFLYFGYSKTPCVYVTRSIKDKY